MVRNTLTAETQPIEPIPSAIHRAVSCVSANLGPIEQAGAAPATARLHSYSWTGAGSALLVRLASVSLLLTGCYPAHQEPQVQTGGAPSLTVLEQSPPQVGVQMPLPAYETAAERAHLGKFDAFDDFRIANKQWYAATEPPAPGTFRSMTEWEPMQEVWTTYSSGMPANKSVRRMYAEQSKAFATAGDVRVIVPDQATAQDFSAALLSVGMSQADINAKVKYVVLPHNAIWHIDYGPMPIVDLADGHQSFVDFVYYKNRHLDDAVPTRLAEDYFKKVTTYRMPFAFEGGNFQADGLGTCATSFRALQNTGFSEATVRNILKRYLGCQSTVIMKDITDDGTGHIDMFFKWISPDAVMIGDYVDAIEVDYDGDGKLDSIVNPDKIATAVNADFKVAYKQIWADNKARMNEMAALWANTTTPNGNKYKVYRLPMMTRFQDQYGDVPRTFINSTFFNKVNAFPSYTTKSCRNPGGAVCKSDIDCAQGSHCAAGRCTAGETTTGCDELLSCSNGQQCVSDPLKVALEQKAYLVWKQALPDYTHIGIRADTIALWSGAIHCITRTLPAKPMAKSIANGLCVQGNCGCSNDGTEQSCSDHKQCFGGKWLCNCNICKGNCAGSGKACTDDGDCGSSGGLVVAGACKVNSGQGCYGQAATPPNPGPGACGGVSFEGQCDGNTLKYCDNGLQSQSCQGCCGWDAGNGYYNCQTGNVCSSCISECQSGQGGCSSQATHSWLCAQDGACYKRLYSLCSQGCSTATGKCAGGGTMISQCPGGGSDASGSDSSASDTEVADAGSGDTGSEATDAVDSGSGDAGPLDTGKPDTGTSDVPAADAAPADVATNDVTKPDVVQPDASGQDVPPGDASVLEIGKVDGEADNEVAVDDTQSGANDGSGGRQPVDAASPATQDGAGGVGDAGGMPPGQYGYLPAPPRSGCTASTQGSSGLAWLFAAFAGLWLRRRRCA